ncbi:sensor histidine kinase [Halobaculum rarum]|uniref:sensor histidine kinase n=1 Tax=Halobaculum rarum TaxID=3075122 RepID=UPI0032AEA8F8
MTLNRKLRHDVLNSVAVIRGWTSVDIDDHPNAMSIIDNHAADIQQAIEEVKHLTIEVDTSSTAGAPVVLADALREAIEEVTQHHPEADITLNTKRVQGVTVYGNEQLSQLFSHLLENAVVHTDSDPEITVTPSQSDVTVSISDDGAGLPEFQQKLLESGDIDVFDDPTTGFGLNVVRLYVENAGATVETNADGTGTTISVTFRRVEDDEGELAPSRPGLTSVQPALPHLFISVVASLIAGIPYGIVSELLGGSVAGIGVFYGTATPLVGWLTHEFHSVVFGFIYIELIALALERYQNTLSTYVGVSILWSLFLWIVAASLIGPVWLQLLDISVPIPSFSGRLLASHLAWGLSLSLLTFTGYRYFISRLTRFFTTCR